MEGSRFLGLEMDDVEQVTCLAQPCLLAVNIGP